MCQGSVVLVVETGCLGVWLQPQLFWVVLCTNCPKSISLVESTPEGTGQDWFGTYATVGNHDCHNHGAQNLDELGNSLALYHPMIRSPRPYRLLLNEIDTLFGHANVAEHAPKKPKAWPLDWEWDSKHLRTSARQRNPKAFRVWNALPGGFPAVCKRVLAPVK